MIAPLRNSPLADQVVLWLGPDGLIELVSDETTGPLGYAANQMEHRPVWEFVAELSADNYPRWWKRVLREERTEAIYQWRLATGDQTRLRTRARSVSRAGQSFVRCELAAASSQVGDMGLAEWGMRQSEGGAARWTLSSTELLLTDSLRALLGLSPDYKLGPQESFFSLFKSHCSSEEVRRLISMVRTVQQSQQPDTIWLNGVPTAAKPASFRIYCEPALRDGRTVALLFWVQRTTPPTLAVDATWDALDAGPLLLLRLDLTGAVLSANRTAREELGYAATDASLPHIRTLDADGLATQWASWVDRAQENEQPVTTNTLLRRADASLLPARVLLTHQPDEQPECLLLAAQDISSVRQLEGKLADLHMQLGRPIGSERTTRQPDDELGVQIVYRSSVYEKLLQQVRTVGRTAATVLILGETGTGKELIARAIHEYSDRRSQVLVKVNCASLPETLAESELFGHEKGAFTGAHAQQIGKFEQADGGTLFLDEIGELSLNIQAKLLRVLQEGEIERIGGSGVRRVDVRVVAATNRNLREMVDQGRFRSDLYFRINVFPLHNPPLRERPEDILPLANHLLRKHAQRLNRRVERLSQAAIDQLLKYTFPGNVRELENIIERAVILSSGPVLKLEDWLREAPLGQPADQELPTFEEGQRQLIERALKAANGRVSGRGGAAELLDLNAQTLYSKMRKLGIEREAFMG